MKIDRLSIEAKLGISVEVFDEIDSTSLYLKRCITGDLAVPGLVIAHSQTNGMGRTGKRFYSPASTGLYLTFAIRSSSISTDDLTARAALATARAIDTVFFCECGVKWVNDIYWKGRKVSGILCQTVRDYILVGIGINVEEPDIIPVDLVGRFGSLTKACSPSQYENLVLALYHALHAAFSEDRNAVLSEYRRRCIHLDQSVTILYDGNETEGICIGIDNDFALLLSINGKIQRFSSGYMSLKLK